MSFLKPLSISEISNYISQIFEAEEMLQDVKIYGEVSNCGLVRGNLYFNLKDENAVIACIMFGAANNKLKDGDQIVATGNLKYYIKGGKLNFYVTSFAPYGQGVLYQKFLMLKSKLGEEGLFDEKFKKTLPKYIKNIGVVTSSTGAVLQDIINVTSRRNASVNLVVYPCRVQGEKAEIEIARGINFFSDYDVDVVIVARGGGSLEDLQPFNTEIVARAVFNCNKPVISAVGHETDYTICDFASSLRAPTPSAAAELVTKNIGESLISFKKDITRLYIAYSHLIENGFGKIARYAQNLNNCANNYVQMKLQKTKNTCIAMFTKMDILINQTQNSINNNLIKLDACNPAKVMLNGWVMVEKDGSRLKNLESIKKDDIINLIGATSKVSAKVLDKIGRGE